MPVSLSTVSVLDMTLSLSGLRSCAQCGDLSVQRVELKRRRAAVPAMEAFAQPRGVYRSDGHPTALSSGNCEMLLILLLFLLGLLLFDSRLGFLLIAQ